jgi:excisionase family DNA binding protein
MDNESGTTQHQHLRFLLTPDEAATALGMGRTYIYALLRTRQLRSVKLGTARRIPVQALESYIARLSVAQQEVA